MNDPADTIPRTVLLTGATGYVGGRLLPLLEARGLSVRCLARRPEHLLDRVGPTTSVFAGDVLDRASISAAIEGVHTAYYLVHSMGSSEPFEETDRIAAVNFGDAARDAGVRRIVYLGGLAEDDGALSPHLRSRQEVGNLLRASGVPVIEFRASIIIGSGSLSFEMIRALVERLPVMITPRWVAVPAQPIAIDDILAYLTAALELPESGSRIFEIGGPDVTSYQDLMRRYADQRKLRRFMLPVPGLTPALSSLWLGLVTPLFARVGRKLIDSIRHPTVVRNDDARTAFSITPIGVDEAIARALRNEDREIAATRWSDAASSAGETPQYGGVRFGNRLIDSRSRHVNVPPGKAFEPIRRVGGRTGWYYANWLWRIRGALDVLVGGVGLRRSRRHPQNLVTGDVIDCWRVELIEQSRRLRLRAEMKLPGRAWLEFEVNPEDGGSRITQTASFDPIGLLGLAYWYSVWPLHQLVFEGMLAGIAQEAERKS